MATQREERRLAAILSADVVGDSRLMEADEKGTLARLQAHRRELFDPKGRRAWRQHRQPDGGALQPRYICGRRESGYGRHGGDSLTLTLTSRRRR